MKWGRWLGFLFGVGILLLGVYLVSSHGSIAGVYLPGLVGLPNCNTGSTNNSTGCSGFALYGGFSVGTVVAIFGLGILGASVRSAISSASAGPPATAMPPHLEAMLAQARMRMEAMTPPPGAAAPAGGINPAVRYCSKCGRGNAVDAKFCQGCGAAMPPPS